MKANVAGKLFSIIVKTHWGKNIGKNYISTNKIFVRNDLFEKIIKSCKTTNLEFLKLKEKLGLCLYDEQEFIWTSEEIFKKQKKFTQHDVENNQLKEENEQLKEENGQLRK